MIIDRCLRGGKQLLPPLRHTQAVTCMALSPDDRLILTGSSDRTARLWDAPTGLPIGLPLQHETSITQVAFSPAGTLAATSSVGQTVWLWDVRDGKRSGDALVHGAAVNDLCFSPDGKLLVTACDTGSALVWDLSSRSSAPLELKHGDWVKVTKYSPSGGIVATYGNDRSVKLWSSQTGQMLNKTVNLDMRASDMEFSPNGRCLATKTGSQVQLWNVATGELIGLPMGHSDTVTGWCFTADSTRLITGCWDKQIRFWDTSNATQVAPVLHHDQSIFQVAISPNGTRLATSSGSTIQFWDLESLQKIGTPVKHQQLITRMQFSHDSQRLISASLDHSTAVWRVDGQTAEKRLVQLTLAARLLDSSDALRLYKVGCRPDGSSKFHYST